MEIATKRSFIERIIQFNQDLLHDRHLAEEEGIINQSIPFPYADVSTNNSYSKSKDEDQYQDIDIENEGQANPYLNPTPAPNPRPKWAQKIIEFVGNSVGDPSH